MLPLSTGEVAFRPCPKHGFGQQRHKHDLRTPRIRRKRMSLYISSKGAPRTDGVRPQALFRGVVSSAQCAHSVRGRVLSWTKRFYRLTLIAGRLPYLCDFSLKLLFAPGALALVRPLLSFHSSYYFIDRKPGKPYARKSIQD